MTTYFEIYFNNKAVSKICNTMSEVIIFIENSINEDRRIPIKIMEKDKKTDRTVVVYKTLFSAKLEWTTIPKYEGETLV
jgi:deoxyadenosine/deoxycytidine kinase